MPNYILVTGGAGYIGSHVAKLLYQTGYHPVILDNLTTGYLWAARWGTFIEGDTADVDLVSKIMQDYHIAAVMHFAASTYVGESVQNPQKYYQNNLINTIRLLEAMLIANVQYIIFSSTCATYGIPQHIPIPETHPQNPVNPYGQCKLSVEHALHWYGRAYGLNWVSLRYFNAAGADQEGELGEYHKPETHLIPLAIQTALDMRPHLNVFGTDYPTPDGTAIRDYIHVEDLAVAHKMALEYVLSGGESCSLNLGNGKGHSVLDIINVVERIGGHPIEVRLTARRPGDPPILIADYASANRILGWQPRLTNIETIVESAYRWQLSCLLDEPVEQRIAPLTKGIDYDRSYTTAKNA